LQKSQAKSQSRKVAKSLTKSSAKSQSRQSRKVAKDLRHGGLALNYPQEALEKKQHLIHELRDEGFSKQEIYHLYLQLHAILSESGTDEQDDFVADNVLDGLTSWGKPQLLPEEPDCT
jgi:hypothetical protein